VCSHSHPYDNNFSRVVSLYLLFSLLKVQNKNKIQGNNNFLLFIFCLFTVSLCFFLFQSGWPSLDAFTRITCCLFVGYHYIYPFLPLAGAVPIIFSASVFLHLYFFFIIISSSLIKIKTTPFSFQIKTTNTCFKKLQVSPKKHVIEPPRRSKENASTRG